MRPRRIRRGDLKDGDLSDEEKLTLQCGHGEFAVEILTASSATSANSRRLQCGHGEFAVEMCLLRGQCQVRPTASMRPRRIRRGDLDQRRGVRGQRNRFNAATANSPWRWPTG